MGRGYVHEGADSSTRGFRLPKNTEEMRSTALYTEAAYPCTVDEEGRATAHAWAGCPAAAGSGSLVSIAQTEAEPFAECAECGFSAASMGKVAAASSSIDNGFEYHYEAVAKAAGEYEEARAELDPLADEVKRRAGGLFDEVKDASPRWRQALCAAAGTLRRGRAGREHGKRRRVDGSTAVVQEGALGARQRFFGRHARRRLVRRSARGVVAAGRRKVGEGGRGALGTVLTAGTACWTPTRRKRHRRSVSFAGRAASRGPAGWARGRQVPCARPWSAGLAELTRSSRCWWSAHVAERDEGAFGARLLSLKEQAIEHPLGSNDVFASIVGTVEAEAVEGIQGFDGTIEIAEIELWDGGPSFPVKVALPQAAKDAAADLVQRAADGLRGVYAQVTGVRVWE
ncbi:MAG: hypothetical protein ACLTMP_01900 [Eggerthella lenta]